MPGSRRGGGEYKNVKRRRSQVTKREQPSSQKSHPAPQPAPEHPHESVKYQYIINKIYHNYYLSNFFTIKLLAYMHL